MDRINKKGINKILVHYYQRMWRFDNFALSDYIDLHGQLNQEVFEDGISISLKCLNDHFNKLLPLLDLIINKPILSEIEFQKVKKSTFDLIKKIKTHSIFVLRNGEKSLEHPYA